MKLNEASHLGGKKKNIFEKLTNVRLYLHLLAIERLPTGFEIN
jgi:hypothetical protein